MEIFALTTPNHYVGLFFILTGIIEIFYDLYFYLRIPRQKPVKERANLPPVSIIICARNEAENLQKFLPRVLKQNYPKFEVIVVNDVSEDNTDEVLHLLKQDYPHLKTTSLVQDTSHGKKLAQTVGIKAAEHEWLVFTDADCYPESDKWLSSLAQNFTDDKKIVIAYGGYEQRKGYLNNLIRFDTAFIATQYLSFAMAGVPYMAVGRNMAYRKSLFFEKKGFAGYYHLLSGDDDLFVNKNATKENIAVALSKESFTRSTPHKRLKKWARQKRRHLTTGVHYKGKHKFLLGLEIFSRLTFFFLFIWLMAWNFFPIVVLGVFFIRYLIHLIILNLNFKHLNEKYLLLPSLIHEIYLPIINIVLSIVNKLTRKSHTWK